MDFLSLSETDLATCLFFFLKKPSFDHSELFHVIPIASIFFFSFIEA